MHLIKYNLWQVLNPHMFRHRGAILRDSFRSREYKPKTPIEVYIALNGMNINLLFVDVTYNKLHQDTSKD